MLLEQGMGGNTGNGKIIKTVMAQKLWNGTD
jgi:hypothetical protein